jgi:hypothetical protein
MVFYRLKTAFVLIAAAAAVLAPLACGQEEPVRIGFSDVTTLNTVPSTGASSARRTTNDEPPASVSDAVLLKSGENSFNSFKSRFNNGGLNRNSNGTPGGENSDNVNSGSAGGENSGKTPGDCSDFATAACNEFGE